MEFEPKNFGFKRGFWNIKVPRKNWRATRGAGIQENRNSITNRNVSYSLLVENKAVRNLTSSGYLCTCVLRKKKN